MTHVAYRDILISTVSASMAGAISALANFVMFFGGRSDDGRPANPLADALAKIQQYAEGCIPLRPTEAHPETAQMIILNPHSGGGIRSLFSTHPPTEERISRLWAMAR